MCVSVVSTLSQTVHPMSSATPIFAFGAPVKCHVITVKFYAEFEPNFTPLVFLSYMIFICFLPYHMRRATLDQEDTILCKTSVV